MLHTYLNTSNPSNSIIDNAYLISNLLKIFVEEDIFLFVHLYSSSIDLPSSISCLITP